jgi:integrase
VLSVQATAAIRLLILTGARLREILHLRWVECDLQRGLLLLPDSKTGRKAIVLNAPALALLSELPRVGEFVVAGSDPTKPRADLHKPWALIKGRAGLIGVRLHDLRHTYASFGAGSGLGLPIIGKLLGHTQAATTQRHAHLDTDPLRRAADTIGQQINKAISPRTAVRTPANTATFSKRLRPRALRLLTREADADVAVGPLAMPAE